MALTLQLLEQMTDDELAQYLLAHASAAPREPARPIEIAKRVDPYVHLKTSPYDRRGGKRSRAGRKPTCLCGRCEKCELRAYNRAWRANRRANKYD